MGYKNGRCNVYCRFAKMLTLIGFRKKWFVRRTSSFSIKLIPIYKTTYVKYPQGHHATLQFQCVHLSKTVSMLLMLLLLLCTKTSLFCDAVYILNVGNIWGTCNAFISNSSCLNQPLSLCCCWPKAKQPNYHCTNVTKSQEYDNNI